MDDIKRKYEFADGGGTTIYFPRGFSSLPKGAFSDLSQKFRDDVVEAVRAALSTSASRQRLERDSLGAYLVPWRDRIIVVNVCGRAWFDVAGFNCPDTGIRFDGFSHVYCREHATVTPIDDREYPPDPKPIPYEERLEAALERARRDIRQLTRARRAPDECARSRSASCARSRMRSRSRSSSACARSGYWSRLETGRGDRGPSH